MIVEWFVFEIEARMNAESNQVIYGPCKTEAEANLAHQKYFGHDTNYYVDFITREIKR